MMKKLCITVLSCLMISVFMLPKNIEANTTKEETTTQEKNQEDSTPDTAIKEAIDPKKGVIFQDALLEQAIRTQLNLQANDIIDAAQATKLRYLDLRNIQVTSLRGLEHFTNIRSLELDGSFIQDFSPITFLENLTSFTLLSNGSDDLSALKYATKLKTIIIEQTTISDFSFLLHLSEVTSLYLKGNAFDDLSVLKNMSNLTILDVSGNEITNIEALIGLNKLTHLKMNKTSSETSNENSILDFMPLANVTSLVELSLNGYDELTNLDFVSGLPTLKTLYATDGAIMNIDGVKDAPALELLHLGQNEIQDFSALKDLEHLNYVSLANNMIEYIDVIPMMKSWKTLDLSFNQIEDVASLKAAQYTVPKNNSLNLSYNSIFDISSLDEQLHQTISLNQQQLTLPQTALGVFSANPILDLNGEAPVFTYVTSGSLLQNQFQWNHAGEQWARFNTSPSMFNFSGTIKQTVAGEGFITPTYSTVTIRYRSWEDGLDLVKPIVLTGRVGEEYESEEKQFTGVTLVKDPQFASGVYAADNLSVTYWYTDGTSIITLDTPEPLDRTSVILKYMNEDNNLLEDPTLLVGIEHEAFKAPIKEFEGYELIEEPANMNGVYGIDTEVVFRYRKVDLEKQLNASSPNTGDATSTLLIYTLLTLSGSILVLTYLNRRTKIN